MNYSNSPLINYIRISPNKTSPRNHIIDTITIHCMAGNLSIERCGEVFAPVKRGASSNYGIGSDGRIALYVEEKDRSWCTSSAANDNRAVTIEVANDGGAPDWHVSDKAMSSLISLAADICKRNNIKELKWQADKSLVGQVSRQNMTVHRWFAAKACPGEYLYRNHGYIADEVNKKLGIYTGSTGGSHGMSGLPAAPCPAQTYKYQGYDYSAVFNPSYYADKYPDVKKAFGANDKALFNHFCLYGMKEGRLASADFNVNKYRESYADLKNAFGDNLPLYYKHYIIFGKKEGRKGV